MPLPLLEHIVYGPVRSRRLGRSLGVNLLPAGMKVCNMDCAYCQYGWTRGPRQPIRRHGSWPTPSQVEAAVAARLKWAAERNELIDRVTVAGHGEPTLHPAFAEIAERLCRVRETSAPPIRLAVLSNSTTAAWPDVRRGLNLFDERHMKLDAGDPITYARINGPGRSVRGIVDALRELQRIIVQAMFVDDRAGIVDNTSEGAVRAWLSALERIRPAQVHIYTIDRAPALNSLRPVTSRRLKEIAGLVHAAGFEAEVFPASAAGPSRHTGCTS
jgi:wyosine [tRNA(Phe)-imidazoG37] synthetase (radical SAM superfamily)